MSYSVSLLAFPDIKDIFDRAIMSPKGIRVSFQTTALATRFCGRANWFRVLDRRENAKLYPEGHLMRGKSQYDALRISKQETAVVIEAITAAALVVDEIT